MTINQLTPTLLLLLAAAFSSWLVFNSLTAPLDRVEPPQNPDAYVFKVNALKMNAVSGKPQDQLFSPQMIHYPLGDTVALTLPHLIVFNDDDQQPWHIYANQGQTHKGIDTIQLWDHVQLKQAAGPANQSLLITTSEINIFPKQQYAATQQAVTLWQPGGNAHATGLRAWQKTGVIDLLSSAHGQYQNTISD
jgi:lipopolysaccharide export system protein LptC